MVTEIIIISAIAPSAPQIGVLLDAFVYDDFCEICKDITCTQVNTETINENIRRIDHIGMRCRLLTRYLFNLDMISNSLHPV